MISSPVKDGTADFKTGSTFMEIVPPLKITAIFFMIFLP
jgi:hypothetical protein